MLFNKQRILYIVLLLLLLFIGQASATTEIISSNFTRLSNDTLYNTVGVDLNTWVTASTLPAVTSNLSGSFNISYFYRDNAGLESYSNIFKNGVAIGTEHYYPGTSAVTWNEVITGQINTTDVITIRQEASFGASIDVDDFRLMYDYSTTNNTIMKPSTQVQYDNLTEITTTSTSWVRLAILGYGGASGDTFTDNLTGTMRITYKWRRSGGSGNGRYVYTQIRKNGDASASNTLTTQTYGLATTNTTQTYDVTVNLSKDNPDTIELWGKSNTGAATLYVSNLQISFDGIPPAYYNTYRVYSFDSNTKDGWTDASNHHIVYQYDVEATGAGTGIMLSNDTINSNEILFDITSNFSGGNYGLVFLYKNTTLYYQARLGAAGAWEIRCFGTSCDGGAGHIESSYTFVPVTDTMTYRGRIHLYTYKNSTFDLLYPNGTSIFQISFNTTDDVGTNFTGNLGLREGSGGIGASVVDNIAYNVDDSSWSDDVETVKTNYTEQVAGQTLTRVQEESGNWVYIKNASASQASKTYLNDTYFSDVEASMEFNYSTNLGSGNVGFSLYSQEPNRNPDKNSIKFQYFPATSTLQIQNETGDSPGTLYSSSVSTLPNTTYILKGRIVGDQTLAKVYLANEIEPGGWQVIGNDSMFDTGFFRILTYNLTVKIDNISVTPNSESFQAPGGGNCSFASNVITYWDSDVGVEDLKACLETNYGAQSYLEYSSGKYIFNNHLNYNGTGNFTVNAPVSLDGDVHLYAGSGNLIIDGATITNEQSVYTGYIQANAESNNIINSSFDRVYIILNTNFTVNNNTLTNSYDSTYGSSIVIQAGSNGSVNNTYINQTRNGIVVLSSNNIQIINNNFSLAGCADTLYGVGGCTGIWAQSNNTYIHNNTFEYFGTDIDNTHEATGIWSGGNPPTVTLPVYNVTILNNRFYNTSWAGILAYEVSGWNISSNNFNRTFFAINGRNMNDSLIEGNNILNSTTEDNILLSTESVNNTIKSNIITGLNTSGWGIFIADGSNNNTLENNTVNNFHRLVSIDPVQNFMRNMPTWDYAISSYGYPKPFYSYIIDPVLTNNVGYFTIPNTAQDDAHTLIKFTNKRIFSHDSYSNISYVTPTESYIYSDKLEMLRIYDCGITANVQTTLSFNVSYCDMSFLNKTSLDFSSSGANNINLTVNTIYPNTDYLVNVSGLFSQTYTSNSSAILQFNFSDFSTNLRNVTIEKVENPSIIGYGGTPLSQINISLENVSILQYHDSDFWNQDDNKEYFVVGNKYNYDFSSNNSSEWTCANISAVTWDTTNGVLILSSPTDCYITSSSINYGWIEIKYKQSNWAGYGGAVFDYTNSNTFYKFGVRTRSGTAYNWNGDLVLTNGSGDVQWNPTQYTVRQSETPEIYYTYRANISNIIELWRTYGNEITYDSQNISEDGTADTSNYLFNFTRFSGKAIGINFTGSGNMTIDSFKAWGDATPIYGNITYTPDSGTIQNFRYLGSGSVDLYRYNAGSYVLVDSDIESNTVVNMLNTTSMRLQLKTNTTRVSSFLLEEDTTAPASITDNQTSTGNFWINNTWTDPADSDFDHVYFAYANGTSLDENVSVGVQYLYKNYGTPLYQQNISAQTVDTSGNINSTKVWFNATTPASTAQTDEFNTGSLNTSLWHWVRENASAWIAGSDYMQINSTNTDMWYTKPSSYAPLLLQNFSETNLSVYTKITSSPDANSEGGGLVMYADDDNYFNVMYYYSSGKWYAQIKKEDNNLTTYDSDLIVATSPIYLNITKQNTSYSGYYSIDGGAWTQIGTTQTITDSMTDVGLTAYAGTGNADPQPFQFDFFRVETDPIPSIPPVPVGLAASITMTNVNWSWTYGYSFGIVTDSYNVSIVNNGVQSWSNQTATFINSTVGQGNWSNITVWAYNNTGGLSLTNVSGNEHAAEPPVAPDMVCTATGTTGSCTWTNATDADEWEVYVIEN